MSRPTRTGTLIESKWKYGTRLWTLAMNADIDASMQSEFVLIPASDTCPNCKGKGVLQSAVRTWTCRECGGRGYVWPDNLVKRMVTDLNERPSLYELSPSGEPVKVKPEYIVRDFLDALVEVDDK